MNKAWGSDYWGQLVNDWDEMPPSDGMINPGYKLEWARFQRRSRTDYLAWQAKIVNEYKRPDQFVTHDFVGGCTHGCRRAGGRAGLDIAAVNPYHGVQDRLDGSYIALSGDFAGRSRGKTTSLPRPMRRRSAGTPRRSSRPTTVNSA